MNTAFQFIVVVAVGVAWGAIIIPAISKAIDWFAARRDPYFYDDEEYEGDPYYYEPSVCDVCGRGDDHDHPEEFA